MSDEELLSEFGHRVRLLRKADGLTQGSLADLAGYSRTTIVNIEAGRQGVTLGTFYRLAVALHCSPSDLLPVIDGMEEPGGVYRRRAEAAEERASALEGALRQIRAIAGRTTEAEVLRRNPTGEELVRRVLDRANGR